VLLIIFLLFGLVVSAHAEPVKVSIEGIEGNLLKNVQEALAIPSGLVEDDTVDKAWLDRFVGQADRKVREALEPFGYYRPRVTASLIGGAAEGYLLTVTVVPGEPVRLTEVEVELQGPGAGEEGLVTLKDAFPLKKGDPLGHQPYEKGKADLLGRARSLGYLDARFPIHEIRVDPETASARLRLVLDTGPRYRFGDVSFSGTYPYPEEILHRYVTITANAPFSYEELGKTQHNLAVSGFFKEIVILPHKERSVDLRVPVEIHLAPAPRVTLRPGVGYGTDTGIRGSLSYKDINAFHLGHLFTVEATAAERFQGIGTNYSMPSPRNLETVTGLSLTLQRENVSDYLSKLIALEVNRTHGFGKGYLLTPYLRLQYEWFSVAQEPETSSRVIMPGIRFSHRDYDDIIRPQQGHHYSLEVRGTHQVLGSDTAFLQFLGEAGTLMPLPWRLSLATRGKCGATLMADSFAYLPASLRFFAGGDTSVRGYAYKSLGPTDASGEVVGGKHLIQGSVELERALLESWGVSIFYDVGNAFDSFADLRLYQGTGFMVHYYTKVGSINLGVARQIGVDNPGYRAVFTIGFQL